MTTLLTPSGKEALRKTIRGLRESLILQLKEEAERVYRLGVPLDKAKLPEARAKRRERLEEWADEQGRADFAAGAGKKAGKSGEGKKPSDKVRKELRDRFLLGAVKEAAHTLINRLVILRLMEAGGLSQPKVLTGGWKSQGYVEFREYADALCSDPDDDTKGYGALLQLVFDELAIELPGVFGKVGLTSLFPIPAATLREVVEALDDPALESAWQDDTTLGWVYQFWNDPEREALDDKINGGGKIEPHEIASKTQMFTERYMVEWLLQNSLGQTWLAMCRKNGWKPEFEEVRESLEARRAEWRQKREAGEVAPDALMPIYPAGVDGELEEHWKYWVSQPMPEDAPATAPERLVDLKLLDPACGSGHFLVLAFDLLGALYAEEARARGERISPAEIAQNILERNLYGVDIDPRAIQIAAAALFLKAKLWVQARQGAEGSGAGGAPGRAKGPSLTFRQLHLVAPNFKLSGLGKEDPALQRLKQTLRVEAGIPEELTESLVGALDGVDHLGSLLRVDQKVRESLDGYEKKFFKLGSGSQLGMFDQEAKSKQKIQLSTEEAQASVMEQLGKFLGAHEGESDLGLRLEGQQLAAGVRFLQMVQEGTFDIVVGNPPYQGTSKMAEADWFKKNYPRSKADLYACFLERGLELAKPGGVSALLTMRGWMFLSSYQAVREHLLKEYDLRAIGDFDRGAFDDVPNEVLSVSVCALRKAASSSVKAVAAQPTPFDDKSYDRQRTGRKRAAVLAQVGRFEFDVKKLAGIEGTPLVYWWSEEFLEEYVKAPKLGEVFAVKQGLATADNLRFLRRPWELRVALAAWPPYIKGAAGRTWFEPVDDLVNWSLDGAELQHFERNGKLASRPQNQDWYFELGVAFAMIGSGFCARLHRFPSIFGHMGSSVFAGAQNLHAVCSMNMSESRLILGSLNPGLHFESGDVVRLPVREVEHAETLVSNLSEAFALHESHREPSVEFKSPGPSPWRAAQEWAQRAVDRPKGEPLPEYVEELDPPEPASYVSFAVGVALGRFGENGEGILDLSLPSGARPEANGRGGLSTAADHVGGAGAQPAGGEEEPGFTPGDGGGHYPLTSSSARGRFGENGEGILALSLPSGARPEAAPRSGAAEDGLWRAEAEGRGDSREEPGAEAGGRGEGTVSENGDGGPAGAPGALRAQTKARSGSDELKWTGAKNAQGRRGASGSETSDLEPGVRDATGADGLEVPNIEPSPLPEGQEILPHGILFLSAAPRVPDSTAHPAFERIRAAWSEHGARVTGDTKTSVEEWLRSDFFAYHKALYENRPIYFPLSSEKKSFVAWVSIHRWADNTLQALLASYLHPAREQLQGEINDLNQARVSSDKKTQAAAEKQYSKTQKLFEELEEFIAAVTQIAEKGAPPTDAPSSKNACPPREVDAPFRMDLDDGVMVNSAALWPLLLPQWKDPKKWWIELCTASGRKDYDWAHLAARYFPSRVDEKCKSDPSLAVAHGCFWKYHPAKAYAWELRLQDEIGPEFTIDESFPQRPTAGHPQAVAGRLHAGWFGPPGPRAASDQFRAAFLRDHPDQAAEIRAKEEQRRERKRNKTDQADDDGGEQEQESLDFDEEA